ncbi:hypothetical protein [Psychrobacter sp. WY6]|uniref:hypothetical protein n=1 Tax=Psychrobacter sp. WY6 TaxID=2708350 RepID=UPI002022C017|nr:hypothetical protein [Psychrobacter sp. WY6]
MPNTSKSTSDMPTGNNTNGFKSDELSKLTNPSDDDLNITANSNEASSQPDMVLIYQYSLKTVII